MGNPHWFKPKVFGYGASPTTWEGWAVVIAYCAVVAVMTLVVVIASEPGKSVGVFWMLWGIWVVVVGTATAVFAVVSKRKTDGEWRWRWGRSANTSFRERWKI